MPRDIPTPLTTARYPALTLAYASARRAELFSALNRLHIIRKHGPRPWDRDLRAANVALVRKCNAFAARCLP